MFIPLVSITKQSAHAVHDNIFLNGLSLLSLSFAASLRPGILQTRWALSLF